MLPLMNLKFAGRRRPFQCYEILSCLPPEKDPRKEGDTAMKLHIKKSLLSYQRLDVIKISFADVEANIRQPTRTSSMLIHRFYRRHILRLPKKTMASLPGLIPGSSLHLWFVSPIVIKRKREIPAIGVPHKVDPLSI